MSDVSLGRVLVRRTTRYYGLFAACFAAIALYGAVRYLVAPDGPMGRAYDLSLGVVVLLVGIAISAIAAWLITLEVYVREQGVAVASLFGRRSMRWTDVTALTYSDAKIRGGTIWLDQSGIVFAGRTGKPIRLITQGRKQIDALWPIVKLAAGKVADRLEQQVRAHGRTRIPAGVEIVGNAFRFRGQQVPIDRLAWEFHEGRVRFSEGARAIVTIPGTGENVLPFLELLERLRAKGRSVEAAR